MNEQQHDSQDTDPQDEAGASFDRGSALSIFQSDRAEDFLALFFAMLVALGVYILV
jgi:hypothetical protein